MTQQPTTLAHINRGRPLQDKGQDSGNAFLGLVGSDP